jgi:hypothetical protein
MRNKNIIFLHIPKSGGSTLTPILNRFYKKEEVFNINVVNYTRLNTDEFINLKYELRRKIRLLTGHMNFGLHEYLDGKSEYITFLRSPLKRAVSYYFYVKRMPKHENYARIKNWSLNDFLTNYQELGLQNNQIRLISGIDGNSNEMLIKANYNAENFFSFIGIQEHYDESLILLKRKYRWKYVYYKKKNVSENLNLLPIDPLVLNKFNELNKEEILFYNNMKVLCLNKISKINNLNFELNKLKLSSRVYSSTKFKKMRLRLNKLLFRK